MGVYYIAGIPYSSELYHYGIRGQKWGNRRFQNEDGSLTSLGKERYHSAGNTRRALNKLDLRILQSQAVAEDDKKRISRLEAKKARKNYDPDSRKGRKLDEKIEREKKDYAAQKKDIAYAKKLSKSLIKNAEDHGLNVSSHKEYKTITRGKRRALAMLASYSMAAAAGGAIGLGIRAGLYSLGAGMAAAIPAAVYTSAPNIATITNARLGNRYKVKKDKRR